MGKKYIVGLVPLISFLLIACDSQRQETITPIYQAQALQLQEEHVQYWSSIDPTTIDPSGAHQAIEKIFGWIPVLGNLIELPIDLTTTLLPPLPSTSYASLPKDAAWNDPRILKVVSSIRLGAGSIRITPPELRGPNYRPEQCWGKNCPELGIDDFLSELRVYLLFKDPNSTSGADLPNSPQVLLASAIVAKDYDKKTQTLSFNVSQENMRPYLDQYADFKVKIVATGNYPDHIVYLDGKLRLDLDLKLGQ